MRQCLKKPRNINALRKPPLKKTQIVQNWNAAYYMYEDEPRKTPLRSDIFNAAYCTRVASELLEVGVFQLRAGWLTECEYHSKHAILDRPFLTTSLSFLVFFFGKYFNHPHPLNVD